MQISGRALHHVFRVGNRKATMYFYREILGMKVLRHEEFTDSCKAQCNGPYDNRWSKTMVGYGQESTHFVIEITYNYGVKSYKLGNEFGDVTIKSKDVIERAKSKNYPLEEKNDGSVILKAPDGYKFHILNENVSGQDDPIQFITYNVSQLQKTLDYWNKILNMKVISQEKDYAMLSYNEGKFCIKFQQISEPLDRAEAFGRIAFGVPYDIQPSIDELIKKNNHTILTNLVTLDTPGKVTTRVMILADPDGHEIYFVDDEGFSKRSEFDPKGESQLDKYIGKDPFQE